MATGAHGAEAETAGAEAEATGIVAAVGRLALVAAFTGVETVALVAWLAVVEDAPAASRAAAVGLGVLLVGLVVEHVLTDLAVNGAGLSLPGARVFGVSVSETALWALWLVVAERVGGLEGLVLAGGVLAVLLVPQHTVEDNVLRGRGPVSWVVDFRTLGFSLVEAAGASVWLLFVTRGDLVAPWLVEFGLAGVEPAVAGVGILAGALFVEHNLGVSFSRRS